MLLQPQTGLPTEVHLTVAQIAGGVCMQLGGFAPKSSFVQEIKFNEEIIIKRVNILFI
jgi:hypothetical protein